MFKRLGALGVAVLLLCAVAPAQDPPPFETLLPEQTIFYLTCRSIPRLRADAREAGVGDLLDEPEVKQFLDPILARWRELTQSQVGMTTDELADIFRGQAGVALVGLNRKPGPTKEQTKTTPQLVFMADVGEKGQFLLLLDRLQAKARQENEKAFQRMEEEFAGTRIIGLLPPPGEDGAQPAPEEGFYYAVSRNVFIGGTPIETIKAILANLARPPAESLATKAQYTEMVQRVGKDSNLFFYLDVAGILALASQEMEEDARATVKHLGFDVIRAVAYGGSRVDAFWTNRVFIKTTGEPRGIMAVLTPLAGELLSAKDAPPDAHAFWTVRFDLAKAFDGVLQIMRSAKPEVVQGYEAGMQQASQQLGQPFDVSRDVLGVLGPRFGGYAIRPPDDGPAVPRMVVIADVRSKADFENMWATLGRLVPPINQFIRSEEYMGQRIYVAAMGPPGQPPPPGRPTPAFCALEKQLVFAVQREDLERHLRGMGQEKRTLEDAPGYRLTSARLPAAPRAAFLFSDQRAQAKEQIESLRKHSGILGKAISEATQKCPPLFRPLLESIDFSKLPSEKTLGPYMAISSGCVMPREDGLEYVDVSAAARVIDRLAEAAK